MCGGVDQGGEPHGICVGGRPGGLSVRVGVLVLKIAKGLRIIIDNGPRPTFY